MYHENGPVKCGVYSGELINQAADSSAPGLMVVPTTMAAPLIGCKQTANVSYVSLLQCPHYSDHYTPRYK